MYSSKWLPSNRGDRSVLKKRVFACTHNVSLCVPLDEGEEKTLRRRKCKTIWVPDGGRVGRVAIFPRGR